jgi:3-deoxy-7-phosphoheptulonate synthase
MIIELAKDVSGERKLIISDSLVSKGYRITEVNTQRSDYLIAIGKKEFDIRTIGNLEGVKDVHYVSDEYQLVSRKWKATATEIYVGDEIRIQEGGFTIMAGPCSVESEEQVTLIAEHLKKNNVKIIRGGAFKPRSSPYAFRGLGIPGLKMMYEIARAYGIKVISEVMEISQISEMYEYVDIFQVGARNTQNFNLLHELGRVDKPVLIKRGISGTVEELLQSAEYVFMNGNEKLILCERGIRTYEKAYRNTLDLNAVPVLKEKSHLPVVVDPSHGIGIRDFVEPMALASVMAGADGVLLEIHEKPEEAFSDGQQTLNFDESAALFRKIHSAFQLRKSW